MDLCGSAGTIPLLYPFVESKDDDVDDGLHTNQALFKCENFVVHARRSYVHVPDATAVLQSTSFSTTAVHVFALG